MHTSAASLDKDIPIYACPTVSNQCHIRLPDLYLKKRPSETIIKDVFLFDPWTRFQVIPLLHGTQMVWLGKKTFEEKVNVMCRNAGLTGCSTPLLDANRYD